MDVESSGTSDNLLLYARAPHPVQCGEHQARHPRPDVENASHIGSTLVRGLGVHVRDDRVVLQSGELVVVQPPACSRACWKPMRVPLRPVMQREGLGLASAESPRRLAYSAAVCAEFRAELAGRV